MIEAINWKPKIVPSRSLQNFCDKQDSEDQMGTRLELRSILFSEEEIGQSTQALNCLIQSVFSILNKLKLLK